jgi:hypothetical protein
MDPTSDDYIRLANEWNASMEKGDSDKANSINDELQLIYTRLVATGGVGALFRRAENETDGVQLFIASHMKEHDFPRALSVYKRLAQSTVPFVAVSAKYILREML